MPTQIRLKKNQTSELKAISSLDSDVLTQLVTAIATIPEQPLNPNDLEVVVKSVIGDATLVQVVMRQVLSLSGLRRNLQISSAEVIEGLDFGIENDQPTWTTEELANWKRVRPILGELLSLRRIEIIAKAIELSYDYANLLRGARIVTDIRPVFDNDASSVVGAVVSFTLRITYDSADGQHSISLALDNSDVEQLQRQCTRAINKAETARKLLDNRDSVEIPAIISGKSTS